VFPATLPPPPSTALAAAWRNQLRHWRGTLLVMVLLCGCIALVINGFRLTHLDNTAVYSYAIGFCCWSLNVIVRLAMAAAQDRWDRARGRAPSAKGWGSGWRGVVPAMVVGLLFGPSMGMTLGDLLTGLSSPSLLDFGATSTRVTLVISVMATLVASWSIASIERLASAREAAQAAQRQAAENQLRLLQSQLEPHMLFNTLANLRVLIGLDAAAAQQMLDRLIAFLRATLEASRAQLHPLSDEFARVEDYLALMAIRMGPRLVPRLDLPEALRGLPVPPLLLQPLVENAIKHGLEPHVQGGRLSVTARRDGEMLTLEVRDTGRGLPSGAVTSGTRFGLAQVRERLATLYGPRASLTLEAAGDGEGGTCARVQLPLDTPPILVNPPLQHAE
jgi:LytS/YehU family sensor histidine kinase